MRPLLEIRALGHRYPDGSHGLADCSLVLLPGSRNALLGANGSGKTTLLQHINGLLRPSSGGLLLDGRALDYSRAGLAALRRRVGLVFQNPDQQLLAATVFEDVSFGPLNLGLDAAQVRRRTVEALQAVGLADLAGRQVQQLSHGQKKRICIAGVLAMEPELLLLDEPMAGLDAAMQEELLTVLDSLSGRGVTLLLSTHDVDFAYRWADAIHLLQRGGCVASFAALALPEYSSELLAAGQPLPAVVALHRSLVERGLLAGVPVPRSLAALQAVLRTNCPKFEFEPGGDH
ncbi:MAG: ABC transporter ATP-binding protein [Azovibrio sp.]|uniref:energy-coupling factor ABC transporter ATP-binding protein n=1 Tax=Azovibrio sp. TaxID=1872673 RepID=UPI003C732E5F